MLSSAAYDDDIDWVAAVAQIENAEASYNKQKQSRATKQQTIDSFFVARPNAAEGSKQNDSSECPPEGVHVPIDPASAATWVYPANVPRRDYQFSITKTALFANTLVSLPTGLGKTLIAAVVIYNFYRWFPQGKIVFTAPSRPLVVQQIEACHNVVGIPQDLTTDMTGQISPAQRAELWKTKRVFFVTPQVLEKDINSGTCPVKQLVCLVVDEAHRAVGNYAYCTAVRELKAAKVMLRILALTATPGSKHESVQSVLDNLNISCMEYRNEDDPDVSQYTHNRKVEVIPVALNAESTKLRDMLIDVLQPVVIRLCNYGVFYNRDIARLTPYEFLTAREKFRQAPPAGLAQGQYGEVEGCFGVSITLCHITKLLSSHGIKPAFEMLRQKLEQGLLARMMSRNEKMYQIKQLMEQTVNHGAASPKLVKMEEIILDHFGSRDPGNTRIIVFTNFRESVKDIMETLSKLSSVVKAMEFIGQSSGKNSKGQSQKIQQQVLQKFRSGGFNVIVATCIGEEGLDIMEVDLVICFDANVSPLRMIQRMGRTGRKRDGRVVVLASEGPEHQGYLNKQAKGKAIGKHMQNGGTRSFNFHSSSRMVPHAFKPELLLLELTIEQFVPRGRKTKEDTTDLGLTNLTTDESSVLLKYFKLSQDSGWSPSLIAFPNYQLFPTPIRSVRHSVRTTSMLIDVLQELRGIPSKDSDENLDEKQKDSSKNDENCQLADDAQRSEKVSVSKESSDSDWKEDEVLSQFQPHSYDILAEEPLFSVEAALPVTERGNADVEIVTEQRSQNVENREASPEQDVEISVTEQRPAHHFYFSMGVVTITNSGQVMVASPPCLIERTPEGSAENAIGNPEAEIEENSFSSSPRPPSLVPESEEFVLETPENERRFASPVRHSGSNSAKLSSLRTPEATAAASTPINPKTDFQRSGSKGSSEVWKRQLESSVQRPRPLKRLKRRRELLSALSSPEQVKGKQQGRRNVQCFIDEEAEVSSDEEVSADEEDEAERSNETFIDDNTQSNGTASGGPVDMMAVYRRSLLTQSPAGDLLPPPGSSSIERTSCQSSSKASVDVLESGQKSVCNNLPSTSQVSRWAVGKTTSPSADFSRLELRKKKLSFQQKVSETNELGGTSREEELFPDDLFDGLDLDALEAEAALKCRSRVSCTSNAAPQVPVKQMDEKSECQPSFDLGI